MTTPKIKFLPNNEDVYLVFPNSYTETKAKQRFRNRFGYSADGVFQYNNQLWVGPLEEKDLMAGLA